MNKATTLNKFQLKKSREQLLIKYTLFDFPLSQTDSKEVSFCTKKKRALKKFSSRN